MTSLNFRNIAFWSGLVKKMANMIPVGKYYIITFFFLTLSVTKKYVTTMCIELPMHDVLLLFCSSALLHEYTALVILIYNIVLILNPRAFMKLIITMLYGRYFLHLLFLSLSSSFFNFCVLNCECNDPILMVITPTVWLYISVWAAYAASIQVDISVKLVAPTTLASLLMFLHHMSTLFNFFQSTLSLFDTL